jgi:transcriptional adapter 2-alpha
VAPELPVRLASKPATINGETTTNGDHVTGGSVIVANGAPPPGKQVYVPPPVPGVQPFTLTSENAPDLHLLTKDEVKLCEILRLQPKPYLMIKEQILKEALKGNGALKKKQAKEICRLDSQKGGRIFDFFVNAGWIAKA